MSYQPSLRAGLAGLLLATTFANTADAAEIVRDNFGVPHVYGENVPDAFFGYGYAVAEDRLFQLEMRRRQATGQLAEVLGKTVKSRVSGADVNILDLDLRMRRDHDPASLQAQFNSLSGNEQALIRGFLGGINKRIQEVLDSKGKLLPQQFLDNWGAPLVHLLKPWTLDDLLAATTNALSSYVSHTTMQDNAKLYASLQKHYPKDYQKIFDTLLWVNDPYAPTIMEDNPKLKLAQGAPHLPLAQAGLPADRLPVAAVGALPESESAASAVQEPEAAMTSMVLLVGKPRTGGPSIQLNGPQPGWFLPSYFYSVGLHAPGYDVVGHAPGGLLAIGTGHNGVIAWGSTAAGGDHTMVLREELSPDRKSYKFQDKFLPVQTTTAQIKVRGADPVPLVIHRTHRGPFITPLDAKQGVVYSKQVLWKGRELSSVMAWQRATQAKDWKSFHAEGMQMAMGYNWFYSDKDGHIGWLFGGFFPDQTPQQKAARDPRLPGIGAEGDVKGRTLADQLFLYDPPSGYILNWNNKPSAHYDNRDLHIPRWAEGDRAATLAELMHALTDEREKSKKPVTEQDVRSLYQRAANQDVNFQHFRPLFHRIDKKAIQAADKQAQQALDLLQKWDGQRLPDAAQQNFAGPAVPIFQEWLNQFVGMTVGQLLADPDFKPFQGPYTGTLQLPYRKNSINLSVGTKIALRGLQARFGLRPEEVPPYDVLHGQDPEKLMLDALHAALVALEKRQAGKKMEEWRQPMVVQAFFSENYESVPTASPAEKPTWPSSANRGAMQRLAVGDGKQIHSVDANPPGTSSDPKSPHYQDQLPIYGNWDFKPLPLNPKPTGPGKVIRMPTSKL